MEFVISAFQYASQACLSCPLAFPLVAAPCSMGEPRLPALLPSHYHHGPGGAARALRGEAAGFPGTMRCLQLCL